MQGEPIDVIPSPEIQYFHDGEPEAHPHVESNTSYFGAIQWNVESWGSDAMNGLGVQQSKRRGHKKCVLKRLESRRAIRRIVEYGELQIHVLEKAGHSHKFK